ncbi:MAG: alpha/beta hydrolase [Thermoanaerobaculia bacterium]|nr:MAG: alpha/beta hydrolase [Thermoanaerobaculia bacterium]
MSLLETKWKDFQTVRYGPEEGQEGDLHLPGRQHPSVVCLLHGGFWRMPYGREELGSVATDLVSRGFAVWNLEYRRLGAPSGGWPETLQDVARGLDFLADISAAGAELDPQRAIVVGHSAGGQLALWAAARGGRRSGLRRPARIRPCAAAGLAAMVDLARAFTNDAGRGAVAELLGGSPEQRPERYADASPISLLPLGVDQLIVHGAADDELPVETARGYARAAVAAGDRIQYSELPGAGHMDYLDPASEAHGVLCQWLERVTTGRLEGSEGGSEHGGRDS